MSQLDLFVAWCRQEQAIIWQQIERLEAGEIGTHEGSGSSMIDTTAQTIEQLKEKLVELEGLLTEVQSTDEAS
jgi:hypothetical protein